MISYFQMKQYIRTSVLSPVTKKNMCTLTFPLSTKNVKYWYIDMAWDIKQPGEKIRLNFWLGKEVGWKL